jgi:hypothetical protein
MRLGMGIHNQRLCLLCLLQNGPAALVKRLAHFRDAKRRLVRNQPYAEARFQLGYPAAEF